MHFSPPPPASSSSPSTLYSTVFNISPYKIMPLLYDSTALHKKSTQENWSNYQLIVFFSFLKYAT